MVKQHTLTTVNSFTTLNSAKPMAQRCLMPMNTYSATPASKYTVYHPLPLISRWYYHTAMLLMRECPAASNADRNSLGNGFHSRVQRGLTVRLSSTGKRTTRRAATTPTLGEVLNTRYRFASLYRCIAVSVPLHCRYITVTLPSLLSIAL